jgi:hypothetical protein
MEYVLNGTDVTYIQEGAIHHVDWNIKMHNRVEGVNNYVNQERNPRGKWEEMLAARARRQEVRRSAGPLSPHRINDEF